MSYANQRKILIERTSLKATKDFLKVGFKELHSAMRNLTECELKLWLYLCENSDSYSKDFSSKDFEEQTGTSDSSYRNAFKKLIKLGYLVQSKQNKNFFLFREYIEEPENQEPKTAEELKELYFKDIY